MSSITTKLEASRQSLLDLSTRNRLFFRESSCIFNLIPNSSSSILPDNFSFVKNSALSENFLNSCSAYDLNCFQDLPNMPLTAVPAPLWSMVCIPLRKVYRCLHNCAVGKGMIYGIRGGDNYKVGNISTVAHEQW